MGGNLVGDCFFANRKLCSEKQIVSDENTKFQFFALNNIFDKFQSFKRLTALLNNAKPYFYSKFSTTPHINFPFPPQQR